MTYKTYEDAARRQAKLQRDMGITPGIVKLPDGTWALRYDPDEPRREPDDDETT